MVLGDGRTVEASLRGRLKRTGEPVVVGDRVDVAPAAAAWTIEAVGPRSTELVRRGRGGRGPKVVAANLDRVLSVVSLVDPPATTEIVDRLLVVIEASGMHPLLVLNKVDLPGAPAAAARLLPVYEDVGYRTVVMSARTGEGLEALGSILCRGASALIGPSGVGKSSILNALDPTLGLRTGELSGKTGTGRHTTVSSRLFVLACGGAVADTPGFGEVTPWGVAPGDVARCFPELVEASEGCRFRTCTHVHEPDCGVRAALGEGRIHETRYESYRRLREEAAGAVQL